MKKYYHNDIFVNEIVDKIKNPTNNRWEHRFGFIYKEQQIFHVKDCIKLNVRMIDGYRSLYERDDNKWSSREIIHLAVGLRKNGIYVSYIGINNKNQLVFNIHRVRKEFTTNKIRSGTKFRYNITNIQNILLI
jgi:hypothetical protein